MGDPTRTAREVVELYNLSLWNDHNFDLALELVADTVIRHGGVPRRRRRDHRDVKRRGQAGAVVVTP
jgi:hypothetical protein